MGSQESDRTEQLSLSFMYWRMETVCLLFMFYFLMFYKAISFSSHTVMKMSEVLVQGI